MLLFLLSPEVPEKKIEYYTGEKKISEIVQKKRQMITEGEAAFTYTVQPIVRG